MFGVSVARLQLCGSWSSRLAEDTRRIEKKEKGKKPADLNDGECGRFVECTYDAVDDVDIVIIAVVLSSPPRPPRPRFHHCHHFFSQLAPAVPPSYALPAEASRQASGPS